MSRQIIKKINKIINHSQNIKLASYSIINIKIYNYYNSASRFF